MKMLTRSNTNPKEFVILDEDRQFLDELNQVATEIASLFGFSHKFKGIVPKRRPNHGSGRVVNYNDGYINLVLRWRLPKSEGGAWYGQPIHQDEVLSTLAEALTEMKCGFNKTLEYRNTLNEIKEAMGICVPAYSGPKPVIPPKDDCEKLGTSPIVDVVWGGITFTGGKVMGVKYRSSKPHFALVMIATAGGTVTFASDDNREKFMTKCLAFEDWFAKFGGDFIMGFPK